MAVIATGGVRPKTCTHCHSEKSREEFTRMSAARDGRSPWCRMCTRADGRRYRAANAEGLRAKRQRAYRRDPVASLARSEAWKVANPERHRFLQRRSHLKQRYGLSPGAYDGMLAAQGGACGMCRKPSSKRLHVDHDHQCCPGVTSCGQCVRGLLCQACNVRLGWLDTNRGAIDAYIRRGDGS